MAFRKVSGLPGKAHGLYTLLLLRRHQDKSDTVMLLQRFLADYGFTRNDKDRGLVHLERTGLIRVERRGRHNPVIHLLEFAPVHNAAESANV